MRNAGPRLPGHSLSFQRRQKFRFLYEVSQFLKVGNQSNFGMRSSLNTVKNKPKYVSTVGADSLCHLYHSLGKDGTPPWPTRRHYAVGSLKISKMGPSVQLSCLYSNAALLFPIIPSTLCLYMSLTPCINQSLNSLNTYYAPGPGKQF